MQWWSVPQPRGCQFFDLPLELRLMIWESALRPLDHDRPGAHFFSLVSKKDGEEAIRLSAQCNTIGNVHCTGYHLAAPKLDSGKGGRSWTNNNPSAYLWDFGMWSACKESRRVIKAHYKTRGWIIKQPWAPTYIQTSVPLTLHSSDEKWPFIIHPKRDLVCLQAFDLSTTHHWVATWYLNYNATVCLGPNGPRFFDFSNLAIAYESRWNDIKENMEQHSFQDLYEEKSTRGFFIRTITAIDRRLSGYPRDRAFWLIDYNLKRVRFPKKLKKGRKMFYSNDQAFTEVYKSLSRRSFSSGENSSALEFLDSLHILLDGLSPSHRMRHTYGEADCYVCMDPSYDPRPYQIHRQVRVLMCEESA
ncbi:hypothetical protein Trisim1_010759 [Trichoderma cf. simile WF8]